jgi:hypothetical protein
MKKALPIIRSINLLVLAIVTLNFAVNFNGFVGVTVGDRFENLLFVAGFVIIIEVVVNLLTKLTENI